MAQRRKSRVDFLKNILRLFALFLIIIILMIVFTDGFIRPVVMGYAENLAEIQATKVINVGVSSVLGKEEFKYSDYVEILKGPNGEIAGISADTVALNILISRIVLRIQQDISESGPLKFKIPVGSISGSAYFIGRGPKVPMNITFSSAVKHSVTSEFSDAGVNQTLHRMVLHITTGAYVLVPFYTTSTSAEVQIPLAETVIVGKVPDAYTVVIEGTNSDMSGKIFDFSSGIG